MNVILLFSAASFVVLNTKVGQKFSLYLSEAPSLLQWRASKIQLVW